MPTSKDQHEPCPSPQLCLHRLDQMDERLGHIEHDLARILHGNGREGLIVRIDRLEQREKEHKWAMGVIFTTLVGLVATTIWRVVDKWF